jgi:hypothetical protein
VERIEQRLNERDSLGAFNGYFRTELRRRRGRGRRRLRRGLLRAKQGGNQHKRKTAKTIHREKILG